MPLEASPEVVPDGLDAFWNVRRELGDWAASHAAAHWERGDAERDLITTAAQLEARQLKVRRSLWRALGGVQDRERMSGSAAAGRDLGFCEVQRVLLRTKLGDYQIPASLYLPDCAGERSRGVLVNAGHYREGKAHSSVQWLCQALAWHGLVALAYDPIGQGQRTADTPGGRWGSWEHEYLGTASLSLGESLARRFVFDAQCALDFLALHAGGAGARLGVAGHSGGGMQTALLMMLEPRIAAAAPAHFVSSGRWRLRAGIPADAEQVWPGMAEIGFDDEDILICMAPRPVMVQAATDDFVPIEGTRETIQRSHRHWLLLGGDALSLREYAGRHEFSLECAWDAADFLARSLGGPSSGGASADRAPLELLSEDDLRVVTGAGSEPSCLGPRPSLLRRRDELRSLRARDGVDDVAWLAGRVAKQRGSQVELLPKSYATRDLGELRAEMLLWWAFEGVHGHGALVRNHSEGRRDPLSSVVIAVFEDGTAALEARQPWLESACRDGSAVFLLDVPGAGQLGLDLGSAIASDAVKGALQALAHTLWWLGDDLVSLRTHAVVRAVEVLNERFGVALNLEAAGDGCGLLYLSLARILEPRVGRPMTPSAGDFVSRWIDRADQSSRNMHAHVLPGLLAHVR